jgi:hypothetical protein
MSRILRDFVACTALFAAAGVRPLDNSMIKRTLGFD